MKKKEKKDIKKINTSNKIMIIYLSFTLILSLLFIRVTYLKVVKGEEYEIKSMFQLTSQMSTTIKANRGSILDRNSQTIAYSDTVYNIILDAHVLMNLVNNKEEEQTKTITALNNILGISEEKIREYLLPISEGKYSRYKIIKKEVHRKQKRELDELKLKGIWAETDSKRLYPYNSLASYIVGFMGGEKGYWGVEQQYNEYLTGISGRKFVTYEGENNTTINLIEPKKGDTIISTIDITIQQFAEQAVKTAMKESSPKNAAIIAMNPNTGEILAMASSPGFDLNNPYDLDLAGFNSSNMTKDERSNALNKLWRNYNISDTYEPGSTFKPIVVATALEEEIVSENNTFNCTGSKQVVYGEKPIDCWKTSGHGLQTLEQALANSCNVAMMEIAAEMGKEIFYKYQMAFGFGEKTGIDLPGEPSSSDFEVLLHPLDNINQAELATMSFGQTFNCTPLQLLNAFSAVINGGNLMKPYTVSQIINIDNGVVFENQPKIERKVISAETSDKVRRFLKSVVDSGTGNKVAIEGYTIGGKTGTAQQGQRKPNISDNDFVLSLVAFLPVENPQIIAMSILDRPKEGDRGSSAPMLKEFLEKTVIHMNIEKTEIIDNEDNIVIEDYSNISLKDATSKLSSLNLKFEIVGTGSIVTNQFPEPDTTVEEWSTIILYVTNSENGEKIVLPDLSGKTYDEVVSELKKLNLIPVVEGKQDGVLVKQEPKADSNIDVGSSVNLKFE